MHTGIGLYLRKEVVIALSLSAGLTALGFNICAQAKPSTTKKPSKQTALPAKVEWYTDFHQGLKAAQQKRKWLFVVVETSWCGVCKNMDANVLPQPSVQATLSRSFICVRLDGDRPFGQAMLKQYNLNGFPSLFVFQPSGALQGKICGGPRDIESFLGMLSAMVAGEAR